MHYTVGDEVREHEFGQRVSFSQDGLPYLNYSSQTWLLDEALTPLAIGVRILAAEPQARADGDPGPGDAARRRRAAVPDRRRRRDAA